MLQVQKTTEILLQFISIFSNNSDQLICYDFILFCLKKSNSFSAIFIQIGFRYASFKNLG